MSLIQLNNLELSYGTQQLLDQVSYTITEGQRICLLGRNGVGKSTLLRILTGELSADDGQIQFKSNLIITKLNQSLPEPKDISCFEYMTGAFTDAQDILTEYYRLTHIKTPVASELARVAELQQAIEHNEWWQIEQRIQRWLTEVGLTDETRMPALSGGQLRLLALARALVVEPDVLLLDEPTNHLDIKRIEWLESKLLQWVKTVLFITHDRSFANSIATEILELDRGNLRSYPGNLSAYFKQKEHEEASEQNALAQQDKKLAQEEVWIRQGIKARRTRNEGRVRALQALREQVRARRHKLSSADISLTSGESSGKLVVELQGVCKSFSNKTLFRDLNLMLLRGDRLGILGDNGTGKSSLIKVMLGELEPDAGSVRLGTRLDVAYFDQKRSDIDLDKSVFDNVADGHDYVTVATRQVHVMSYLQQYLFSPDRVRQPARALSGGELSRLSLAKLMSKPFNLLVMDEPTNDLDMETLEVLENQLADYDGTLILISHDRKFIDNTVSTVLHLDGKGNVNQCVGGYSDWVDKFKPQPTSKRSQDSKKSAQQIQSKNKVVRKKLSYHEQRELDKLPEKIELLETELLAIQQQLTTPEFSQLDHKETDKIYRQLADLEANINSAYERWEELSAD